MKDIYGSREGNYYENGIAEATDAEDFMAKLESLQSRWEVLCPGFFEWFNVKTKSLFLSSVIKLSRENSDINGLYYQNDIERFCTDWIEHNFLHHILPDLRRSLHVLSYLSLLSFPKNYFYLLQ